MVGRNDDSWIGYHSIESIRKAVIVLKSDFCRRLVFFFPILPQASNWKFKWISFFYRFRTFKSSSRDVQASEHLLHASVISMVEFDDDIFAAGHCFDWNQHRAKSGLYCPFAYRLPPPDQGAIFAKNLATEYHYLGNTSEWFFLARQNAEKVIAKNEQYIKGEHKTILKSFDAIRTW